MYPAMHSHVRIQHRPAATPKRPLLAWLAGAVLFAWSHWTLADEAFGWQWANPLPTGATLEDVAHNGNRYVAVGQKGAIVTSSDGQNWQLQPPVTYQDIRAIAWNGSLFVAVGAQATNREILTSPDGINWTSRSFPDYVHLFDVTWGNGQFIAVGAQGKAFASSDGITWTSTGNFSLTDTFNDIEWDGSRFLLVTKSGTLYLSTDGSTWTKASTGYFPKAAASNGSRIVAVGSPDTIIFSDDDGATWSTIVDPDLGDLRDILWDGNQFIAVGSTLFYSSDGENWTAAASDAEGFTMNSLAPAAGGFVAVGKGGVILTSGDGQSWQRQGSSLADKNLSAPLWDGSRFVVIESSRHVLTSSDGLNWQAQAINQPDPDFFHFQELAYDGSRYVAISGARGIYTSTDLINWTRASMERLQAVIHDGSQFIAVGRTGIYSSSDGETWQQVHAADNLNDIAWNGSVYIAVGVGVSGGERILRSTDGQNWTGVTPSGTGSLYAVAWGNNRFVATGMAGSILVSTDGGETWTAHSNPISFLGNYDHLIWTGNQFVAISNAGLITSPDGENWKTHDSLYHSYGFGGVTRLAIANNRLIATGDYGTIIYKDLPGGNAGGGDAGGGDAGGGNAGGGNAGGGNAGGGDAGGGNAGGGNAGGGSQTPGQNPPQEESGKSSSPLGNLFGASSAWWLVLPLLLWRWRHSRTRLSSR